MPDSKRNSYATEVIADNSGKWAGNLLRWPLTPAGKKAAETYIGDLMWRWHAVRETRVVESYDPVTEEVTS